MLSIPHILVIFLIALVVLGPEKLPQVARSLGKMMAEFRRMTGDFRYQIENEMREMERQANVREAEAEATIALTATSPALPAPYETAQESALEAALILSEKPPAASPSEPAAEAAPADEQKLTDGQSRPT